MKRTAMALLAAAVAGVLTTLTGCTASKHHSTAAGSGSQTAPASSNTTVGSGAPAAGFTPPAGYTSIVAAPLTSAAVTPARCAPLVNPSGGLLPNASNSSYGHGKTAITISSSTFSSSSGAHSAVDRITTAVHSCPSFRYGSIAFTASLAAVSGVRTVTITSSPVDVTVLVAVGGSRVTVAAVAAPPPGPGPADVNAVRDAITH